jgi:uncharacterized protein YggL (DUF469 family)
MSGEMRKRLRKKKRVGEFKELCFEVRADLAPGLDDSELFAFLGRLIPVVEARQLMFGGGAGRDDKLDVVVSRDGRGSATEADRAIVAVFLEHDPAVASPVVGPLRDAWYDWA